MGVGGGLISEKQAGVDAPGAVLHACVCVCAPTSPWVSRADQWVETTTECYLWSADSHGPQPAAVFRDTAHTHIYTHTHTYTSTHTHAGP